MRLWVLVLSVDVGGDCGALCGDWVAARCPGAMQRSRRTLLRLLLRTAWWHDGHSCAHQQRNQLRPVLHHECSLQADIRTSRLAVQAARRRFGTPPPSRRRRWPRRQRAELTEARIRPRRVGGRRRTCQETRVLRLWRTGDMERDDRISWGWVTWPSENWCDRQSLTSQMVRNVHELDQNKLDQHLWSK